jgi:type I restriction enzyme S subunit
MSVPRGKTLPDGWGCATIADLRAPEPNSLIDGPFGSNLKTEHYRNDGPLVIRLQNIGDGVFLDSKAHISLEHFGRLRRHEAKAEDLVIAILGDPVPRCCLVPVTLGPAIVKADCIRLRADYRIVLPTFAMYAINSHETRRQASKLIHGVGRPRLNLRELRELQIPLAPTPEQSRIVDAIETNLTKLDAAVAALGRAQANLKRYRASVLKAAVEGRLVPTEAELARQDGRDYEPSSKLIARTPTPPRPNRWNSRSKDIIRGHAALAVGNPKSELPEGWAWSPLVDIARMESGHTPSREHPEWWEGTIPWIGIADAREHNGGIINDTFQHTNDSGLAHSAARLLPTGTVCVSRTASVGYVVVMGRPMATSQDFVNWIPTPAVTSDWLRVVFSADREALRGFGKGSVHKTIYFPEWLAVHVALPPLTEQERIVPEVDRHLSVAEELKTAVAANFQRTTRLRQSILKWAFEGKLVDQDPNDEPATLLLERIRLERENMKSNTSNHRKPKSKKRAA